MPEQADQPTQPTQPIVDWRDRPVTDSPVNPSIPPLLTDEQFDEVKRCVLHRGRERYRNMGKDFNEADYLAGAMVAIDALLGKEYGLVPGWIFGVMSGRSPIGMKEVWRRGQLKHEGLVDEAEPHAKKES